MPLDINDWPWPEDGGPEKRKPAITFLTPKNGAYAGQDVILIRAGYGFCHLRVSDIEDAGQRLAADEKDEGEFIDRLTPFTVAVAGTNDTKMMHLDRHNLALAYNAVLDKNWPAGIYDRDPKAPPPLGMDLG